ncbi:amidohydrolase family protein [Klebsiella pneumoniae]|uniref:Amidohydrolase family protein n=1 Tax=Klebsiella pneumoniae TaxID=573 RepID=A0A377XS22_KLEPN|nr:amidohydrolase family protein [Klebsiella pneumoniae]
MVTVGSIQAGHAPNIINDHVLMKLTVRTLNEQVRETVLQRIHDIAVAQAESFNATATLTTSTAARCCVTILRRTPWCGRWRQRCLAQSRWAR